MTKYSFLCYHIIKVRVFMKKYFGFILLCLFILSSNVYAKQGCCSKHDGVVGCTSSSADLCGDGTISPTCTCTPTSTSTSTTISGCTNSSAINYNSKANKNDGSCHFKKTISENEDIKYDIEYVEDETVEYGKEVVKTNGSNGIKKNTYEVVSDSNNNVISSTLISSEITTYPVNEVINRNTTNTSETSQSKSNTSTDNKSSSSNGVTGVIGLAILGGGATYIIKRKPDLIKKILKK